MYDWNGPSPPVTVSRNFNHFGHCAVRSNTTLARFVIRECAFSAQPEIRSLPYRRRRKARRFCGASRAAAPQRILSGHGAWAPLYRLQWRQVVIAIPARRMQQDRLQAGHTIPPSRSGRQASERPPCCHKESAVAYLLPILAAWEPVERRRQLYVSETSS
jgi:hypothetical protein